MARTAKRYKKNTEKKVLGIPVCMAAIYVRLSVDSDEKKSEPILIWEKPEQILTDRDLNG